MQECDKTLVFRRSVAPRIAAGDHVGKNDAKGPDVAMSSGISANVNIFPDAL